MSISNEIIDELKWGDVGYTPFSKIIVRFDSKEDFDEFGLLIGKSMVPKIKKPIGPVRNVVDWEGMPEFVQEKQDPFTKITIEFGSIDDLNECSAIIGQPLTPKSKSIWHPKLVVGLHSYKRYIYDPSSR